ncbi:MAG: alpha/beta hydrolase [Leptospirales bacterium]|jgi:pimeloyl-ACP methyl ester carboxylesterase
MKTIQSKDGTQLAYDVYGSGPALIFVAGAMCFRSFDPILQDVQEFAKHFTVYIYDRRGRGDSGDTPPYSREREIEDIDAMIAASGGPARVYGHSSGAVLALEAAARLGDRVLQATLYDPSYVHDEAEKETFRQLSLKVHRLLQEGKNGAAMTAFLKGIGMPGIFVFLMRLMPAWRKIKALAPTLAYDIALTEDLPPLELASKIRVPVQIVVGEKSPASIHSVARQLMRAIPAARLDVLAGQDHMVNAKVLLPIVLSFLNQGAR